jgi:hypothetical protein
VPFLDAYVERATKIAEAIAGKVFKYFSTQPYCAQFFVVDFKTML